MGIINNATIGTEANFWNRYEGPIVRYNGVQPIMSGISMTPPYIIDGTSYFRATVNWSSLVECVPVPLFNYSFSFQGTNTATWQDVYLANRLALSRLRRANFNNAIADALIAPEIISESTYRY